MKSDHLRPAGSAQGKVNCRSETTDCQTFGLEELVVGMNRFFYLQSLCIPFTDLHQNSLSGYAPVVN
jgi:hypothetical protein